MAGRGAVFIGIGGIGGEALVSLKQLYGGIAREGGVEPAPRYLLIDSEDFALERGRGPGAALAKNESMIIGIDGGSFEAYMAGETHLTPRTSTWLPLDSLRRSGAVCPVHGAGQCRVIGRLILAHNLGTVRRGLEVLLREAAEEFFRGEGSGQASGKGLDIHLFYSVAGGTGAGMFLDVAFLARAILREWGIDHSLRHVVFMPDIFRLPAAGSGENQMFRERMDANAYGSLLDFQLVDAAHRRRHPGCVPTGTDARDVPRPRRAWPLALDTSGERQPPEIGLENLPWDEVDLVGGDGAKDARDIVARAAEGIFLRIVNPALDQSLRAVRSNWGPPPRDRYLVRTGRGIPVHSIPLDGFFSTFGFSSLEIARSSAGRKMAGFLAERFLGRYVLRESRLTGDDRRSLLAAALEQAGLPAADRLASGHPSAWEFLDRLEREIGVPKLRGYCRDRGELEAAGIRDQYNAALQALVGKEFTDKAMRLCSDLQRQTCEALCEALTRWVDSHGLNAAGEMASDARNYLVELDRWLKRLRDEAAAEAEGPPPPFESVPPLVSGVLAFLRKRSVKKACAKVRAACQSGIMAHARQSYLSLVLESVAKSREFCEERLWQTCLKAGGLMGSAKQGIQEVVNDPRSSRHHTQSILLCKSQQHQDDLMKLAWEGVRGRAIEPSSPDFSHNNLPGMYEEVSGNIARALVNPVDPAALPFPSLGSLVAHLGSRRTTPEELARATFQGVLELPSVREALGRFDFMEGSAATILARECGEEERDEALGRLFERSGLLHALVDGPSPWFGSGRDLPDTMEWVGTGGGDAFDRDTVQSGISRQAVGLSPRMVDGPADRIVLWKSSPPLPIRRFQGSERLRGAYTRAVETGLQGLLHLDHNLFRRDIDCLLREEPAFAGFISSHAHEVLMAVMLKVIPWLDGGFHLQPEGRAFPVAEDLEHLLCLLAADQSALRWVLGQSYKRSEALIAEADKQGSVQVVNALRLLAARTWCGQVSCGLDPVFLRNLVVEVALPHAERLLSYASIPPNPGKERSDSLWLQITENQNEGQVEEHLVRELAEGVEPWFISCCHGIPVPV